MIDAKASAGRNDAQPPPSLGATEGFEPRVDVRRRRADLWRQGFRASTLVAILVLAALLLNVANSAFGYTAVQVKRDPATVLYHGVALDQLDTAGLVGLLESELKPGVIRRLNGEAPLASRSVRQLHALATERIVQPKVVRTWSLLDSVFRRGTVKRAHAAEFPNTQLAFRSWLTLDFLLSPQDPDPEKSGVSTAIKGSLWMILITILFAFPVGVGAAIYLEEYADKRSRINQLIQTNINNLAGVPSIIYGMLGLAILVRFLQPFTSGAIFGMASGDSPNGRTILSGGLTLGLLILPVLIINGQEAIRAVPQSLRQASFGLGGTKWQTIWHHVLPGALPGILTGAILAVSRAIGETAPILVIGASTYVALDPSGPFSKFTALPIQIYQWTSRPSDVFRNIAAAAILALLILLLTLNASAIFLRNRYRAKG
ncbi:MAG: phosphate ABC transporter permease PstA [Ardenticatenales bacterium]|jgi:phosphate transport system permease protein|nr:phosphate ABC transporter permease PstA [Ardenticatenales bacterium]